MLHRCRDSGCEGPRAHSKIAGGSPCHSLAPSETDGWDGGEDISPSSSIGAGSGRSDVAASQCRLRPRPPLPPYQAQDADPAVCKCRAGAEAHGGQANSCLQHKLHLVLLMSGLHCPRPAAPSSPVIDLRSRGRHKSNWSRPGPLSSARHNW